MSSANPNTPNNSAITASPSTSTSTSTSTSSSSSSLALKKKQKDSIVDPITPFLSKHIPVANDKKLMKDNYHRYCYRHNPDIKCNKEADEHRMAEIQRSLDKLPMRDQVVISNVWSVFSAAPSEQRILLLKGLLSQCCFPQLSFISSEVKELIKIDFIRTLPVELSLKILCYLDCASLCNAAQVSKTWKRLADDDRVWHHLCEQHIDRKCPNCGWGLPLMHMKRARENIETTDNAKALKSETATPSATASAATSAPGTSSTEFTTTTRTNSSSSTINTGNTSLPASQNTRTNAGLTSILESNCSTKRSIDQVDLANNTTEVQPPKAKVRKTRPWKAVYSERFKVERNWRKGIFKLKEFHGHSDGILCLQFNHRILITGSYDCTAKVWDIKTGKAIRTLTGHTRGVRALVFDDKKVITGGLDSTIRIWNLNTGECLSTYRGHSDAIISLDLHGKTIVSGSADNTIKVWNVETRTCHTLRGHTDWVNCVKIHAPSNTVISSSDDCTIRLWSLKTNNCLKIFSGNNGHIGQVQCALPLTIKDTLVEDPASDAEEEEEERSIADGTNGNENTSNGLVTNMNNNDYEIENDETSISTTHNNNNNSNNNENMNNANSEAEESNATDIANYPTNILSAGLDNQIKVWDVKTGKCVRTQFGHIEGVWSIAADTFRIVSGAHDKLVKVWDLQSGKCIHTFGGHNSSVSCVDLSDSRFAGGDESGLVRMYCFDDLDNDEFYVKGKNK